MCRLGSGSLGFWGVGDGLNSTREWLKETEVEEKIGESLRCKERYLVQNKGLKGLCQDFDAF